jgi:hypothetical protein
MNNRVSTFARKRAKKLAETSGEMRSAETSQKVIGTEFGNYNEWASLDRNPVQARPLLMLRQTLCHSA